MRRSSRIAVIRPEKEEREGDRGRTRIVGATASAVKNIKVSPHSNNVPRHVVPRRTDDELTRSRGAAEPKISKVVQRARARYRATCSSFDLVCDGRNSAGEEGGGERDEAPKLKFKRHSSGDPAEALPDDAGRSRSAVKGGKIIRETLERAFGSAPRSSLTSNASERCVSGRIAFALLSLIARFGSDSCAIVTRRINRTRNPAGFCFDVPRDVGAAFH